MSRYRSLNDNQDELAGVYFRKEVISLIFLFVCLTKYVIQQGMLMYTSHIASLSLEKGQNPKYTTFRKRGKPRFAFFYCEVK